jgi:sugar phosphate isomerase/epimerase
MGFKLQYYYPFWGSESITCNEFFRRVIESGFDGIEINLPNDTAYLESFSEELSKVRNVKPDFGFIAQ